MSYWRIVFRSLVFHWKINFAVGLGVAAATAVLTGALLVGDSVRGSLRTLTLERLGAIDELIVADRFFRGELANELIAKQGFRNSYQRAVPVILFPDAAIEERVFEGNPARAGDVSVTGVEARFWELDTAGISPLRSPADGEIVINATLAAALQISREQMESEEGVELTVRLPKPSRIPSDNPLGRRDDQSVNLVGLTLVDIIPDRGLGRFSMHPNQTAPRNAYVNLTELQEKLEQEGKVNSLLIASKSATNPPPASATAELREAFEPNFDDYGFIVKEVKPPAIEGDSQPAPAFHYYSIASERLLLESASEVAAAKAFPTGQPVLTYLANEIRKANSDIPGRPYTMITAIDVGNDFPLLDSNGKRIEPLGTNEIVVNSWMADQLGLQVDDRVRLFYFEPENTHSDQVEVTADFVVKAITPLTTPVEGWDGDSPPIYEQPPQLANDPDLTPTVPGITDAETIDSRDLPFEQSRQTEPIDDDYWSDHRTTPSAFVSLQAGRKLWGSRFGNATSFRIPISSRESDPPGVAEIKTKMVEALEASDQKVGFQLISIKRKGLEASAGSTPFDVLFLMFSMFIIAAALMLVGLLFRLGVEQRVSEIGILQASGFRQRKTGWMLTAEGTLVASLGALVGVGLGIAYAALMILGLTTIWVEAVATPFLTLDLSNPLTLLIGYFSGVLVCALTIALTIFRLRQVSVRNLLVGKSDSASLPGAVGKGDGRTWLPVGICLALLAAGFALIGLATQLGGEAQAGAFMGGGFALLGAGLAFAWTRFRYGGTSSSGAGLSLLGMVRCNAGRNPSRSVLTIGLIAVASFLILAVSSFRLQPTESGTAGFDFIGQTSAPVFKNVNNMSDRSELLADDAEVLKGGAALPFRYRRGDNASCNNLYQAQQPRVLGVTDAVVDYFGNANDAQFEWADSAAETKDERANPWRLLQESDAEGPIPVVIDKNTAMYSLKLYYGIGEEFEITYPNQPAVRFRVVGLLSNSILQGSLLVGERDFERIFPDVGGYQYFLLKANPEVELADAERRLEDRLSESGLDLRQTKPLLKSLLEVQNNYIAAFQALGALGLVLGTLGLATVQLRGVLERRSELALMRAAGFRQMRLALMVLLEHLLLLGLGLGIGLFAAALSVAPHVYVGGASPQWDQLAVMLAAIVLVGVASGYFAVLGVLQAPLLGALRGE